jgi:amidase|tara:strand:- start:17150 stop:18535 length:1386 start_codon:yes stop_codon:yes gene_type:complete
MDELLSGPVRKLAAAVTSGEITSLQLVSAYLDRINEVNPKLNAVVHLTAEAALKHARSADTELKNGRIKGPLHGVPITIKDSLDTTDAVTTWGTKGRAEVRPGADATCVARLRDAGAILMGKTNTPEFTLSFETDNLVYGRTNNPYDLARTAGGSSGGAAAIIAAGGSPLDIGTDTAGSIRLPAHFCGIAGIKPTAGRVPCTGNALPTSGLLAPLSQPGPMGRFVDDLIYVLPIIAGPDRIDQGVPAAELKNPDDIDVSRLRFGFHTNNGIMKPTDEIAAAVTGAVQLLSDSGFKVDSARPTGIEMSGLILSRLFAADGGLGVEALLDDARTGEPSHYIANLLELADGPQMDNREFAQLIVMWDNYRSSMLSYFTDYDVLICPVNASAAVFHGTTDDTSGYTYTSAYNLAGWPGVVIRAGTTADHLPIGIQILAEPWREDIALAVARWLEEQLGAFPGPEL